VFLIIFLFHPFHASVTDIVYKEDSETLEITHRFFIDDMEETLDKTYESVVDIIKEKGSNKLDSLLNMYIQSKFKMIVDEEEVVYQYIGHEIEEDAVWIYTEVKDFEDDGEIHITNSAMIEIFPKQTNIVHFDFNGEVKSLRLHAENESGTISFKED
jgi:hypothetical protein